MNKEITIEQYKDAVLKCIPDKFEDAKASLDVVRIRQHGRLGKRGALSYIAVCYDTPMEYIDKSHDKLFRIVPSYPTVSVSRDGTIIHTKSRRIVAAGRLGDYSRVIIRDVYNKSTMLLVHRIVALAWVPNDDFVKYNIVDHIDGNKLNNVATNLRWVSNGQNTAYAANISELPWTIKDCKSGEIKYFYSLGEFEDYTGYDKRAVSTGKCPMYIKTDKGEWLLDHVSVFSNYGSTPKKRITGLAHKRTYHLIVDGKLTMVYDNIMDIIRDHGMSGRMSFDKLSRFIESYYSADGKAAEIKDVSTLPDKCTYQALDTTTGIEYDRDTIAELAKQVGVAKSTLISRYSNRVGRPIGKWLFKRSTDDKYPVIVKDARAGVGIRLTKDGKVVEFDSLRSASKFLGIDRKTLIKYNNRTFNGYNVTVITYNKGHPTQ